MLLQIEAALTVLLLGLSLLFARRDSTFFRRAEAMFVSIARRRVLATLIVMLLAVVGRLIALPLLPVPVPKVDDEYSHLLLADTILHGRFANPTHPMWEHLETLAVNMRPSYASAYQPLQGVLLALGRLTFRTPFAGVVLSVALMCGAICWSLQGFLPEAWALLGALLAAARFGVFTYWGDSYMGGAPAAIGGALVLGAFFRIKASPSWRNGAILGLGIAVLGWSRPFEGLVLSAAIAIALVCWLAAQTAEIRLQALRLTILPAAAALLLAGVGTAYYDWRVTGNPFRSPYQVIWQTYGMMPKFFWQPLRPEAEATLRHPALTRAYYVWERSSYESERNLGGFSAELGVRALINWEFYFGPLLSLPFLAAAFTVPYGFRWGDLDPKTRLLILIVSILLAALIAEAFSYPHYAAPLTTLFLALIVLAMREVRARTKPAKNFGVWLSRLVPLFCFVILLLRAFAGPLHIRLTPSFLPSIYYAVHEKISGNLVDEALQRAPGPHLVIVHFHPDTESWMGWVHNDADIDRSKIVWAWDMGPEKNRELLNYFSDRKVWIVDSDGDPPILKPYSDDSSREGGSAVR